MTDGFFFKGDGMRDILDHNKKIIVNTDIDGILSAFVLCHYCGCEIVGFSNSSDSVWWRADKIKSIYEAVYIDMYVARKDVLTIDQHIVSYDKEQCSELAALGTKINPNLENPRSFTPAKSYKYKYPFATVHYILAKLGGEGLNVQFDLSKKIQGPDRSALCFGDFLLRADDAMKTTLNSPYKKNAREWWEWLSTCAGETRNISDLVDFLRRCPTDDKSVEQKKIDIKTFFRNRYGCRKSDGGFKRPCDENGMLTESTKQYFQDFWGYLGDDFASIQDILEAHYECAAGKAHRIWIRPEEGEELKRDGTLHGETVFSYGYVNSPDGRFQNFSYTVM